MVCDRELGGQGFGQFPCGLLDMAGAVGTAAAAAADLPVAVTAAVEVDVDAGPATAIEVVADALVV